MKNIILVPTEDCDVSSEFYQAMLALLQTEGVATGMVVEHFGDVAEYIERQGNPDLIVMDVSQIEDLDLSGSAQGEFSTIPLFVVASGPLAAVQELVRSGCGEGAVVSGVIQAETQIDPVDPTSRFFQAIKVHLAGGRAEPVKIVSLPYQMAIMEESHRTALKSLDGADSTIYDSLASMIDHSNAGYRPDLVVMDFGWITPYIYFAHNDGEGRGLDQTPVIVIAGHESLVGPRFDSYMNIIGVVKSEDQYPDDNDDSELRRKIRAVTDAIRALPAGEFLTRERFVAPTPVSQIMDLPHPRQTLMRAAPKGPSIGRR